MGPLPSFSVSRTVGSPHILEHTRHPSPRPGPPLSHSSKVLSRKGVLLPHLGCTCNRGFYQSLSLTGVGTVSSSLPGARGCSAVLTDRPSGEWTWRPHSSWKGSFCHLMTIPRTQASTVGSTIIPSWYEAWQASDLTHSGGSRWGGHGV